MRVPDRPAVARCSMIGVAVNLRLNQIVSPLSPTKIHPPCRDRHAFAASKLLNPAYSVVIGRGTYAVRIRGVSMLSANGASVWASADISAIGLSFRSEVFPEWP